MRLTYIVLLSPSHHLEAAHRCIHDRMALGCDASQILSRPYYILSRTQSKTEWNVRTTITIISSQFKGNRQLHAGGIPITAPPCLKIKKIYNTSIPLRVSLGEIETGSKEISKCHVLEDVKICSGDIDGFNPCTSGHVDREPVC